MMAALSSRYALRSVGRNARRTLLSVAGIGVGCFLALFMESLNRGIPVWLIAVATVLLIGALGLGINKVVQKM